jgi:hypothetical protein
MCKTDLHASLALCIAKIVSNRAGKPPTEHCATPLSARHPSSQQLPPDRRNKSAQGLLRGGERVEQGARRRTGEARRRAGERGRGARAEQGIQASHWTKSGGALGGVRLREERVERRREAEQRRLSNCLTTGAPALASQVKLPLSLVPVALDL